MAADPKGCLLVRVAGCVTGLVRLDPDAVLDVDQLLGVILTFGADEDVACVIATSPRPLTTAQMTPDRDMAASSRVMADPVLGNTWWLE